jgi:catechol 2,3-dioxygenase-like lactoylglutathione lyase family enzyme
VILTNTFKQKVPMAKLRHIAINCDNLDTEANFYKNAFELEEVGRVGGADAGAVYLSDGIINVALIKMNDPNFPNYGVNGLNHIGFVVKDLDAAIAMAEKAGAVATVDPNHRQAGATWEMKMKAPSGVDFDLSDHGWPGISQV